MAKAKKRVKAAGIKAVALELIPTIDTPSYYVNHLEVTHLPYEFGLLGTRLPIKLSAQEQQRMLEAGKVAFEPTVHLILPTAMLPGLIRALQIQQQQFEDRFGKIVEPIGVENAKT
jgi:hypothetical protein